MIYAIQGKRLTPVKIGYTKDEATLKSRIATLQTGYPYELRALLLQQGDLRLERAIHIRLHAFRLNGEWFEWSNYLREYLRLAREGGFGWAISEFKEASVVRASFASMDSMGAHWDYVRSSLAETPYISKQHLPDIFGLIHPYATDSEEFRAAFEPIIIQRGNATYRYYNVLEVKAWLKSKGIEHNLSFRGRGSLAALRSAEALRQGHVMRRHHGAPVPEEVVRFPSWVMAPR